MMMPDIRQTRRTRYPTKVARNAGRRERGGDEVEVEEEEEEEKEVRWVVERQGGELVGKDIR